MRKTETGAFARTLRAIAMTGAMVAGLPALAQHAYPTPEAVADALGDAIARSDTDALRQVLGNGYPSLLPPDGVSQDDIYDFLAAWSRHHAIEPDGAERARVAVGNSGWTFPAPLVRHQNGWRFDLRAGQREVRLRRLGRNELVTMETLLALADAQQRYADSVGKGRYAAQLVSQPGKTNGLYWPADSEANASPFGPDALAMGPDTPPGDAYYGYYFRVIAPGKGDNEKFAFLAWPARYGESGVHTFLLGSDRSFYERDFGPSTPARARGIRTYSTDGWKRVSER